MGPAALEVSTMSSRRKIIVFEILESIFQSATPSEYLEKLEFFLMVRKAIVIIFENIE